MGNGIIMPIILRSWYTQIIVKIIGAKITPDLRNLIGASCLKNFLIENVAFANLKFAGEEAPYTKKYLRVRGT